MKQEEWKQNDNIAKIHSGEGWNSVSDIHGAHISG